MREIKFRGRTNEFSSPSWVYGDLICDCTDEPRIMTDYHDCYDPVTWTVDPATVGQYIGAPDSKDNEIYEGDIVKFGDCVAEVAYNAKFASFGLYAKGWAFMHYFGEACNADQCEVIGNIHDNPNLLEADDARD